MEPFKRRLNIRLEGGLGSGTIRVAVSDLNRDGKLDIVAVNSDSNNISVLLGNGDGTFADAGKLRDDWHCADLSRNRRREWRRQA